MILIDNSPTAIILPTNIFDFLSDVDDYYMPVITGSYFRLIRIITLLFVVFLSPIYLLLTSNNVFVPNFLTFLIPTETYNIPIVFQFVILEFVIDSLKLASLNTPQSLGMSLSIIGALILGDISIKVGWFIPHTILLMAFIALSSFIQPSTELSYALKFMRFIFYFFIFFFGLPGFLIGIILIILILLKTKTINGNSYLYPFYPYNKKDLKKLIFRTSKKL